MDLAKYRALFLEEATEHLAEMSRALLALEKDAAQTEAIDLVFRMAHSIKGMAASLDYGSITLTPSPPTTTPSPYPSITPPPSTATLPAEIDRASESPRRFDLSLILGLTTIVIGGLLWWRFSRKR